MRLNRKASLEIGVNTIVILVIAMMLLGLGIGFVKNLFDKMNKVPEAISIPEIGQEPTSTDPIVLAQSGLSIKSKQVEQVGIGVYNKWDDATWFTVGITSCTGLGGEKPLLEALPQAIGRGEASGFLVNVYGNMDDGGEKGEPLGEGTYICNIAAFGGTSETSIGDDALASSQFKLVITG